MLPNTEALINIGFQLVEIAGLCALVALIRRRRIALAPVGFAILALALGHLAIFTHPFGWLEHNLHTHWNWDGKLLSILVTMLCVALFPGISWRDAGFTWNQNGGVRAALVAIGVLCIFGWSIQALHGLHVRLPPAETLLYQATLPGLNEEPLYRGLAMVLINRAFLDEGATVFGARFGWGALITSVWFGLIHAVGIENGHLTAAPLEALTIAVDGCILAWIFMRTRSLVFGVIGHNVLNVGSQFIE